MNPRDSARAGSEAIRSFLSPSNVVFLGLLAALVVVAAICATGSEDGEELSSTTVTSVADG